jgi:BirA family transcriptional regulator, biotin operon repressor / biotin---[acetyl-CoA-carboxylase] ligase
MRAQQLLTRVAVSYEHASEPMKFVVHRFDSLDSTNRYVLDEARGGAPEGLVAIADHQTAGRGRRGRSWLAPPGASLLVSVLFRPDLPPDRIQLVTMAAGVALAEAVELAAGFSPALKWPNDLIAGKRKLAGLLSEADGDALVVGAGLNVQWDEFPAELAELATSCNREAGRPVDRDQVLDAYLERLAARVSDVDAITVEYRRRLATIGSRVRVERIDGDLVGLATDVGSSGELLVETDAGATVAVHSGDVVHLRRA